MRRFQQYASSWGHDDTIAFSTVRYWLDKTDVADVDINKLADQIPRDEFVYLNDANIGRTICKHHNFFQEYEEFISGNEFMKWCNAKAKRFVEGQIYTMIGRWVKASTWWKENEEQIKKEAAVAKRKLRTVKKVQES